MRQINTVLLWIKASVFTIVHSGLYNCSHYKNSAPNYH